MRNHGRMLSAALCPNTMTPTRFLHLLRTYAIMVFAKGSWYCERRRYSSDSDQPDVGPINMHTSITATEARRIIIPHQESEFQFNIFHRFSSWVAFIIRSPKARVAPTLCLIHHPTRKNRPAFATTRDSHASLINCGGLMHR